MVGWSLHARTIWQSWNGAAVRRLGQVFTHPRLLRPDVCVDNISSIDIAALHRRGIRAVVLDKDNTITAPYSDQVHHAAASGLTRIRETFTNTNAVSILSNSAGTDDDVDHADALHIESSLGVPVIRHKKKKPDCIDDVLGFINEGRQEESLPALATEQVAMIGDRLLTDVVFGNLHGMVTIHCQPLSIVNDNPAAKFIRFVPLHNFSRRAVATC